jgi:hypothetical protein
MAGGKTTAKRLPLPRRFPAALTEDAHARLRALNARYGLGNNYLLSVLLERLDDIADADALDAAFRAFIDEYGAPRRPDGEEKDEDQ